jgi:NAD(P)-dependent dehydrogenase (short-subunit alcohol dehydrogenase family)
VNVQDHQGAVALVTGGAKGLGADIARAFFASGASVLVADIDEDAGKALCEELDANAAPGRAFFLRTDITRDEDLDRVAEWLSGRFGKLDCLVNNACLYADEGLASSRRQWLDSWNVNVVSGALLVQRMRALLRASGAGSVVNMSSIAGKIGQRGRALYPACKAAILQLTRSEAVELAADGIRVNAVTPAWTWSPAMSRQVAGDRALADRAGAATHPLGRVGEGDDVAAAVLFLCSPAARFVTGVDLPVDGGHAALGPDQGRGPMHWFDAARNG